MAWRRRVGVWRGRRVRNEGERGVGGCIEWRRMRNKRERGVGGCIEGRWMWNKREKGVDGDRGNSFTPIRCSSSRQSLLPHGAPEVDANRRAYKGRERHNEPPCCLT